MLKVLKRTKDDANRLRDLAKREKAEPRPAEDTESREPSPPPTPAAPADADEPLLATKADAIEVPGTPLPRIGTAARRSPPKRLGGPAGMTPRPSTACPSL